MAEGDYGAQGSSQWTHIGQRFHERHKSARMSSAPGTRTMNPLPHAGTFAHRSTSRIVTIK